MIFGSTSIEISPDGTGNIGGILNGNWSTINNWFNCATGFTASQSLFVVTASGAIFIPDMVGSIILWGNGASATITGYTSATQVTVGISQTVVSQTFEVYRTDQTDDTALARGLVKKVRFVTTDDGKQLRWSNSLQQFVLYGGYATLTYASTVTLDFSVGGQQVISLTGNITFAASNMTQGTSLKLIIKADSSTRNFTFPGWVFIGASAPASIAANKTAILTLECTGTTAGSVIASYAVQP